MQRLGLVTAVALLILWQSNCLTLIDGKLINRCGIWQYFTNSSLVLLVEEKNKINTVITLNPDAISKNYTATLPEVIITPVVPRTTHTMTMSSMSSSNYVTTNSNSITVIPSRGVVTMSGMVQPLYTTGITAATMGIGSYGQGKVIYCPGNNNTCIINEK